MPWIFLVQIWSRGSGFMTFQLLEFSWKFSHFFHTLYLYPHPLFPGKSDPHAGLLAYMVLSCKLGEGNLSSWERKPCRGLDLAETVGSYVLQDARWIWASLSLWLETLEHSGEQWESLPPLCCPQATHVSAVLLGDNCPAESYWVEQVLTERQSSTVGTA